MCEHSFIQVLFLAIIFFISITVDFWWEKPLTMCYRALWITMNNSNLGKKLFYTIHNASTAVLFQGSIGM